MNHVFEANNELWGEHVVFTKQISKFRNNNITRRAGAPPTRQVGTPLLLLLLLLLPLYVVLGLNIFIYIYIYIY